MDASTVERLLAAGEGETVEFKARPWPPAGVARVAAAFANTKGGYLLLGVADTGAVTGLDPDETDADALGRLAETVRVRTEPPVDLGIEAVRLDGRTVAVVHVPYTSNSTRAPFATDDGRGGRVFYVRRGASNAPASMDDLRRLALTSSVTPFEDTSVPAATFADLDFESFRDYLARRSPSGRHPDEVLGATLFLNAGFAAPRPPGGASIGHTGPPGPANSAAPTVAALLLFGSMPQRLLSQARIELVRFAGDAPGDAVTAPGDTDRETVEGTLPEQYERALAFIGRHMRVGTRVEGFGRTDVPEYPLEVVRELLLNALIHRDYAQTGASIQVRMYFDRWEFTSPGRLPGPLTPDSLHEGAERFARNPRIADAMRTLGYGEGLGLGLHRARRALRKAGYPALLVQETPTSVTFTLSGAYDAQERQAWLHRHRDVLLHSGGNDRQLRALEYLADHDALTNTDYRRLTGAVDMTALRDLTDLAERGILERHGQKRGTYYVLAAPQAAGTPGTPGTPAPPQSSETR